MISEIELHTFSQIFRSRAIFSVTQVIINFYLITASTLMVLENIFCPKSQANAKPSRVDCGSVTKTTDDLRNYRGKSWDCLDIFCAPIIHLFGRQRRRRWPSPSHQSSVGWDGEKAFASSPPEKYISYAGLRGWTTLRNILWNVFRANVEFVFKNFRVRAKESGQLRLKILSIFGSGFRVFAPDASVGRNASNPAWKPSTRPTILPFFVFFFPHCLLARLRFLKNAKLRFPSNW